MLAVRREVDRALTLLRNKIRERGFTQLEIQEALLWGRSYISQLLTRQKALRLEQILLILRVIDVNPAEFFAELYHRPADGGSGSGTWWHHPIAGRDAASAAACRELRALLHGLIEELVERGVIDRRELDEVTRRSGFEADQRNSTGLPALNGTDAT